MMSEAATLGNKTATIGLAENSDGLVAWCPPENSHVLRHSHHGCQPSVSSIRKFPKIRVPQIIQNWTILVLKPMVCGSPFQDTHIEYCNTDRIAACMCLHLGKSR